MSCHLVLPDAHAKPGVSNDRFLWLGKLIVDIKPDVVICLGDFADMYSLNGYDRGKASFHSASYKRDIEAALDAQEKLFRPIKQAKKKRPRMIMLGGNHEQRILKVLDEAHYLDGAVSWGDLELTKHWEYYPFLEKACIDGIIYSHCLKAGNSGNMMGGKFQANSMLMQEHCSITVGHSHLLDYRTVKTGDGKRLHGLVAGCYFEHDERYAFPNDRNWWRGITVKRGVHEGNYDPEFISLARIKQEYK